MLKFACPHCSARVELFSRPWQSQRASQKKVCPECGRGVEMVFRASRYILSLVLFLAAFWAVSSLLGVGSKHMGTGISLSFGLALFLSMYLRKQS